MNRKSLNGAMAMAVLAVAVANAYATDSTTTTTTTTTSTAQTRVITTPSGKYTCPISALTDGRPNLSLCTPVTTTSTGTTGTGTSTTGSTTGTGSSDTDSTTEASHTEDRDEPSVVCIPTNTAGSTSTTSTTGTGTGTTGSTTGSTSTTTTSQTQPQRCAVPTVLHDTGNLGRIGGQCVKGGTRTVTGGYDPVTGKIDITITLKDCIDAKEGKHNGTAAMQGTIILKTGSTSVYTVKDTKTVMDTVTFSDGTKLIRSCTLTRDGEYDSHGNTFNGKSTRNDCVLDGQYKFKDGLVDNLISNSSEVEQF